MLVRVASGIYGHALVVHIGIPTDPGPAQPAEHPLIMPTTSPSSAPRAGGSLVQVDGWLTEIGMPSVLAVGSSPGRATGEIRQVLSEVGARRRVQVSRQKER